MPIRRKQTEPAGLPIESPSYSMAEVDNIRILDVRDARTHQTPAERTKDMEVP